MTETWSPLARAFWRWHGKVAYTHDDKSAFVALLRQGKIPVRVTYGLQAKRTYLDPAFWSNRAPLWTRRGTRPYLLVDEEELRRFLQLPPKQGTILLEVPDQNLDEFEGQLGSAAVASKPQRGDLPTLADVNFVGGETKHDWCEVAAVAAIWLADNDQTSSGSELKKHLERHLASQKKSCPERRELERWITHLRDDVNPPSASTKVAPAPKRAGRLDLAHLASFAGSWMLNHSLEEGWESLADEAAIRVGHSDGSRLRGVDVQRFAKRIFSLSGK